MFVTSVVWPKQLEQKRGLPPTATMPPDQDRNEVSLDLVFFPTSTDAVWAWCPGHR